MKLDLSSIYKAISSLERAIVYAKKRFASCPIDQVEQDVIKAGVIQNFEFTYELCWKFMKRWLEQNYSESFTAGLTRKQLFRYALENHLIVNFENWIRYHELRNMTSHTYDQEKALEIYSASEEFLNDAQAFYAALEVRND